MLNERSQIGAKIFSHYTDIVIFVSGYFNLAHPITHTSIQTDKHNARAAIAVVSVSGDVARRGTEILTFGRFFLVEKFSSKSNQFGVLKIPILGN